MKVEKKDVQKLILMSRTEAKILSQKAKDKGISEGAYVRFLLSQKPNDYPEIRRLLADLINEVNRIGVNINQITRNNNSGFYSAGDKARLIAYMRKLNREVREVLQKMDHS